MIEFPALEEGHILKGKKVEGTILKRKSKKNKTSNKEERREGNIE